MTVDFTQKITLKTAQAYLEKLKSDLAEKYKYIIAGKTDATFQGATTAIKDNDVAFDALKRVRVQEKIALGAISRSADDDDTKAKRSAVAQMDFIRSSLVNLKSVSTTSTAKAITTSLFNLATTLKSLVTQYTAAQANAPDAAKDAQFAANVRKLSQDIKSQIAAQVPRLAAQQVLYSNEAEKSKQYLKDIEALLVNAASPPAAVTVPADTDGNGSTLDVTA